MALKTQSTVKLPDIGIVENANTRYIFEQIVRFIYSFIKDVHDDFVDNGVVRHDFDNEMQLLAGLKLKRTAVAVTSTASVKDCVIGVTSTAAARTINLPAAATAGAGKI